MLGATENQLHIVSGSNQCKNETIIFYPIKTSSMKTTAVLILLMTSNIVLSQHTIDGWDKAKWGMTFEQTKELYPSSIEILKDDDSNLFIVDGDSLRLKLKTTTSIIGYEFELLFVFDNSKLRLINLEYRGEEGRSFIYGQLKRKLQEKYGSPSSEEDTFTYYLYFEKGKIQLSYLSFSENWPVILSYEQKTDGGL